MVVARVRSTSAELLSKLPVTFKDLYAGQCATFSSLKRQTEWIATRLLFHNLLGLNVPLTYTDKGKPILEDGSAFVSISHTSNYVAVMLHPSNSVGIDVERLHPRVKKVISRFMRSDETALVYKGTDLWSLLLIWSAKESVYKAMCNPSSDLLLLRVLPFVPQNSGVLHLQSLAYPTQSFIVGYRLFPEFVLTYTVNEVCTDRGVKGI